MTILFVCTGNTCRSPMAEGLFHMLAASLGLDAEAASCGLIAMQGEPAAENAIEAAAHLGADISGHAARQITEAMVAGAAHILGMTRGHVDVLRLRFPDHASRIDTLDNTDIADPFGGGSEIYADAAAQIHAATLRLVSRLARESDHL